MSKSLSRQNVVLLALMLGIALWYAGHECGEYLFDFIQEKTNSGYNHQKSIYWFTTLHFSVACAALLINGILVSREHQYVKRYCVSAAITFAYPAIVMVRGLAVYDPDTLGRNMGTLDLIILPAVMLSIAAIVAVNYIICAIQVKKQLGY